MANEEARLESNGNEKWGTRGGEYSTRRHKKDTLEKVVGANMANFICN